MSGKITLPALGHIGPEVRSFYSVDDNTCLLAGAEQEGPAHNPWSTHTHSQFQQLTVHTPYVHLTFVTVFDQPYGARSIAPTFIDMVVIEVWLIKVVTPSQK